MSSASSLHRGYFYCRGAFFFRGRVARANILPREKYKNSMKVHGTHNRWVSKQCLPLCPHMYRWVNDGRSKCRVLMWNVPLILASACVANRWLPTLPTLVAMTASLWTHHQTSWCVKSAFLYLVLHTKWHAVGESTAKPAWMNTRDTLILAQTVGREDRTSLTPEVSEFLVHRCTRYIPYHWISSHRWAGN